MLAHKPQLGHIKLDFSFLSISRNPLDLPKMTAFSLGETSTIKPTLAEMGEII